MTPQEIHNLVDLGIQKLGSFVYDQIKPEYIDLIFNRMGDAYISETVSFKPKNFESNTVRLSDIKELVTTAKPLVRITSSEQYAILPYDFMYAIEAKASVIHPCDNSNVSNSTTTLSEYISVIPFKKSNFGTPPTPPFQYVKVFIIKNTSPVEIFDFTDYSTGLNSIDEIFTVINKILEEINRSSPNGLKVYWEKYRDYFYPDSFIFVSTDDYFFGEAMKIEYTNALESEVNFTETTFQIVSSAGADMLTTTQYCRLVSNEDVYHLNQDPFSKTNYESPLITISKDILEIYRDQKFILKDLDLRYIRKPRRLNLPLNQSYGIDSHKAIEKIIDMTVQYFHANVQSQSYQAMVNENNVRD